MTGMIKTGVVGVGSMGAHHARVYAELDESELVGVCDLSRERTAEVTRSLGCRGFHDPEDLLRAGVEAVTVAVPTSQHAAVAGWFLERGVDVLVEKPIAPTVAEAESLIARARAHERVLMVGHIERFNPAVQAIKAAVAPEDIISINIMRVGPRPPRIKDAGVIIDMAVHDIDLVHHLTEQRVEEVFCVTSSHFDLYEDTASILLRTVGGASAQLTANWITPYKAREIQVVTAERLVRANLLTQHVQEASRYENDSQSYLVHDIYVRHREPLRSQLEAFLDAVRTRTHPPVSGEDGLRVLEVALRAAAYKRNAAVQAA